MHNKYILSIRGKSPKMPVLSYIDQFILPTDDYHIESVFGFVEKTTLYGGRPFVVPEISDEDIEVLHSNNIILRLPLTNSFITEDEYNVNRPFLDKYYEMGANLIVTNDNFAKWIRRDYPNFVLEASAIKDIKTVKKAKESLELYDSIVLPSIINEDYELLQSMPDKDRIILFGNAGCAWNCPSKICYPSVSKMNKYKDDTEFKCSQSIIEREVTFRQYDLDLFNELGYNRFKILRPRVFPKTIGVTGR